MESSSLVTGLNGPAHYITAGPFQVSVANFIVIAIIVVLFVLAIVLPFPHGNHDSAQDSGPKAPLDATKGQEKP
jgi:large-conductance mechanosensitive channel